MDESLRYTRKITIFLEKILNRDVLKFNEKVTLLTVMLGRVHS